MTDGYSENISSSKAETEKECLGHCPLPFSHQWLLYELCDHMKQVEQLACIASLD